MSYGPDPIVYIVDDDVSAREALELLFDSLGLECRAFGSAQGFLAARPPGTCPSCLVLDICLPGISGLDLHQRMVAELPTIPVIFLTAFGDVPMTVRAMKAGAVEFLEKPVDDECLADAVRNAIGQSRNAIDRIEKMRSLQARYQTLSARERQVMTLVSSGLLNKQVAGQLGICEITVKVHRGNVMRKMKASSLPDLVLMAQAIRDEQEDPSRLFMPAPAFYGRAPARVGRPSQVEHDIAVRAGAADQDVSVGSRVDRLGAIVDGARQQP